MSACSNLASNTESDRTRVYQELVVIGHSLGVPVAAASNVSLFRRRASMQADAYHRLGFSAKGQQDRWSGVFE